MALHASCMFVPAPGLQAVVCSACFAISFPVRVVFFFFLAQTVQSLEKLPHRSRKTRQGLKSIVCRTKGDTQKWKVVAMSFRKR